MAFDLGAVIAHIKADVSDFQKGIGNAQKSLSDFGKGIRDQGTKMTAFVTTPLVGLGLAAVKSAADMEQLEVSFSTMLGSADKAKTMLGQLTDFAAKTPFQLGDVQESAKMLLAYGVSADKVQGSLKAMGDVAAGTNTPIAEMAEMMGKMHSQQVVYTEDLNQLSGRGIPILDFLAKKYKTNVAGVRELASQGKLSFKDIEEGFTKMSGEGGIFFNMMDAQSKTAAGQWSNLQDSVAKVSREIGEILVPYVVQLMNAISGLVNWFAGLDENQKKVILTIIGIVAVVGPLLIILGTLIGIITSVIAAFTAVATAIGVVIGFFATLTLWPVLLVAGLVALIAAIVYFVLQWTGLWDEAVAIFRGFVDAVWGFISWLIGGLMSIFQSFYTWLVGGSLIPDLVNLVISWIEKMVNLWTSLTNMLFNTLKAIFMAYVNFWKEMIMIVVDFATGNWTSMWNRIKSLFEGGLNFIKNIGEQIKNAIMEPFNRAKQAAEDAINAIRQKMEDLNPMKRHSPSVVDLVTKGVDSLIGQFGRLGDLSMPGASAMVPAASGQIGSPIAISINMAGANISSPQAASQYAEMIGDKLMQRLKTNLKF